MRRMRVGLTWGCALVLAAAPAAAQPTVSLSAWQATNGTGIRFAPLHAEVVPAVPRDGLSDETVGGSFAYAVDTSALSWGADCTCYRYYVIVVRSRATNVVTRHKFRGIPSGSFEDQRVQVRLAIQEGDQTHTDDLTVPVASTPGLGHLWCPSRCPIALKACRSEESPRFKSRWSTPTSTYRWRFPARSR